MICTRAGLRHGGEFRHVLGGNEHVGGKAIAARRERSDRLECSSSALVRHACARAESDFGILVAGVNWANEAPSTTSEAVISMTIDLANCRICTAPAHRTQCASQYTDEQFQMLIANHR
jgi:hypothetical protein